MEPARTDRRNEYVQASATVHQGSHKELLRPGGGQCRVKDPSKLPRDAIEALTGTWSRATGPGQFPSALLAFACRSRGAAGTITRACRRPANLKVEMVYVPQSPPALRAWTVPRVPAGALGLALAVAFALVPAAPARAHGGHDTPEVPDSSVGDGRGVPLTASDRDFVVRVRLAGLWEMPAGMMATTKGVEPRVREIGREIAGQHATLDRLTRDAAAQLGVRLPDRPTPEQQGWLFEMQRARGSDFDRVFVLRLRAAHGLIFPAIGTVRAGTHNDVVRRLAQEANQFVLTHLTLLESTGLVNYASDVPTPADPAPLHLTALAAVQPRAPTGGAPTPVLWSLLALALLAGGAAVARVARPG